MSYLKTIFSLALSFYYLNAYLHGQILPRTVIALYEPSIYGLDHARENIHIGMEMPLNYLGLVVEYHSTENLQPNIAFRSDVIGILVWLSQEVPKDDAPAVMDLLEQSAIAGKKILIIDNVFSDPQYSEKLNKLLDLETSELINPTYGVSLRSYDPWMFGFERSFKGFLPAFDAMKPTHSSVKPLLTAQWKSTSGEEKSSVLLAFCRNGAYLNSNYTIKIHDTPPIPLERMVYQSLSLF